MGKERKIYHQIHEVLTRTEHQIVLLFGLRKTGKTTILTRLSENLRGYYHDFRQSPLCTDEYYSLFDKACDYLFFDEIGYLDSFDEFMGVLPKLLAESGKKAVITSSSYGLLKQLAAEKLGSRCYAAELFPLGFEEYLYFSDKIAAYGEDYQPRDQDLQDFYRLKNIPADMRMIIDKSYMQGIFTDTQRGYQNQVSTVRDIELKSEHYEAVIDIIAYTLNQKISMKRFKGAQIGIKELDNTKGLHLSESLIGMANRLVQGLNYKDLANIIAYMLHNGFLFVDLVVNEQEKQSADDAYFALLEVRSEEELRHTLKTYTYSVISPLLYTRLLVDLETLADKLCANPSTYGELYELTAKAESIHCRGFELYHKSYKYQYHDRQVDLVVFCNQMILEELTISHKPSSKHFLAQAFRDIPAKRILTDTEGVWKQEEGIFRIGYPKALLMLSRDEYPDE